jgi:hypothetical protein
MGKTYRRDSGFRPNKGRGFKDFKQSRKFKEKEFERFDKYGKKILDDIPPDINYTETE